MSDDYLSAYRKVSQKLRRDMTPEERKLWYDYLKGFPAPVHRQKVIGTFIVDFYIHASRIAIEVDGMQHYEGKQLASDRIRDAVLFKQGILVLRYRNQDIINHFDLVCRDIYQHHIARVPS